MTREEAIERLEWLKETCHGLATRTPSWQRWALQEAALNMALTALRGPTREMVERMRVEWVRTHSTDNFWTEVWKCSYCGFEDDNGDCFDFCPDCGQPKTNEAVDMMLERWKEAVV